MTDGFYIAAGDGAYTPTRATESPWDRDAQHGGPPSALLARAMRELDPRPPLRLARITVEFLGTIPRAPLTVEARVARPGRRIRMLEATMAVDGRPVALARAWEIAAAATIPAAHMAHAACGAVPGAAPHAAPGAASHAPLAPLPPAQPQRYFVGLADDWGYGNAIEWRFVSGGLDQLGPGSVWTRLRLPLVAGRPPHGVDHALVVADAANGVSGMLPHADWLFVPPTITVTLHRHPEHEWVRLDAQTELAADGVGSTTGALADRAGTIGTVTQPLLIAPRS